MSKCLCSKGVGEDGDSISGSVGPGGVCTTGSPASGSVEERAVRECDGGDSSSNLTFFGSGNEPGGVCTKVFNSTQCCFHQIKRYSRVSCGAFT